MQGGLLIIFFINRSNKKNSIKSIAILYIFIYHIRLCIIMKNKN